MTSSAPPPPGPKPSFATRVGTALRTGVATSRSLTRGLALLFRFAPFSATAIVVITMVQGVIPGAMAVVGKWVVDGVMRAAASGHAADRMAVVRYLAIELGLVVGQRVVSYVASTIESMLQVRYTEYLTDRVIQKLSVHSLAEIEDTAFRDRLNNARRAFSYGPLRAVTTLLSVARGSLTLGTYCVVLWALSPWLVAILLVAAVPHVFVDLRLAKNSFRVMNWRAAETRQRHYFEWVLTDTPFAKELRLFGLLPMFLGKYRALFEKFWKEDRALALTRTAWSVALVIVGSLAFYAVYGWIAWQAMVTRITVGDVSMYLLTATRVQDEITGLIMGVSQVFETHLHLGNLFEFLDLPSTEVPPGGAAKGTVPGDGIRFENVSFTYPGNTSPTLADVTLHVRPGEKVALVGENGAGKTTLIKLLTRLYVPTSGRITLDGLDLREWDGEALRGRIGVIFQDFVQYSLTIGQNIGAGDVAAFDDEPRWREAAEQGTADEFISALPEQYQTDVGRQQKNNARELSGGQWQKIALSRAFMRKGADILVLDEPTASIDAAAEAKIFERFGALTEGRTAVLISHRFSTVRMADTIVVIEGGRVREQGSHDELIARSGRYAELFFLQARGYR